MSTHTHGISFYFEVQRLEGLWDEKYIMMVYNRLIPQSSGVQQPLRHRGSYQLDGRTERKT